MNNLYGFVQPTHAVWVNLIMFKEAAMLEPRAPPSEQPVNVPDERADKIDFREPCKRCQVECDYCKGWKELFAPEGE
jgi:hypothetical protein